MELLPTEVLHLVAGQLGPKDLGRLAQTCRRIRDVLDSHDCIAWASAATRTQWELLTAVNGICQSEERQRLEGQDDSLCMDWAALDPYLTFRDAALGYMADLSVLRGASCPTRMTITRARGTLRNVRGTLVAGGIRVRTFHLPEKCQPVTGLAVTGPHVFVAAAGQGTLHVLDTATGRHVASLTHRPSGDGRAEVSCVAAMPNTGEVIVGTRSGRGGFLQCFRTGRHAWAWDTGAGVPVACGGCPGVAMALLDTGVLVGYDPLAGGREEFRLVATGSRVLPGACMKCVESASGKWHAAVVALTERAASSPQRTVCAFVDVDDGRLLSCIAFPPPERGPAAVLSVAAVSGDIRSQADLLRQSATASGHGRGVNFVLTVEGVPVWRGCATVWLLEDGSLRSKVDGDLQGTLVQPARCRHAAVEVGCSEEAGRGRAGQAGQRGTSGMRCVLLSTGAHVHTVSRLRVDTAKKQGRVPGVRAKLLHCAAGAWEACAAFEDGTVTVVHF